MLAYGVLDDERLELTNQLRVSSERELRFEPLLEGGEAHFLEPFDRASRKGLVAEIRERRAAPQRQRLAEEIRRALRLPLRQGPTTFSRQALEPAEVELIRVETKAITGRRRFNLSQRQRLPELRHLTLHLRDGSDGRRARI